MMKILILTGKFGLGHYSVSDSLQEQIKETFPKAQITIIDFFQYSIPKASKLLYQSFTLMINRASRCYNWYYKLTDEQPFETKSLLGYYFLNSMTHLIEEHDPICVISTLPFCSHLMSIYKKRHPNQCPFITCITDISTHSEWIHPHTDCYLVASSSMEQVLIRRGIDPKQIKVIGIPVKSEFRKMCASTSLPASRLEKRILMMGGGLGLLPQSLSFYDDLNALPGVKTTVITGKNKKLFHLLHGKYENIEVIGFTDKVYQYMQHADLIISKPGGITVFEAIYSELPMLVIEPFLQQEINNATFVHHHQVGKILTKQHVHDTDFIRDFIEDESALAQMRLNMKQLKQQLNVDAIEKLISTLNVQKIGEYVS